MDCIYEETSSRADSQREQKIYKITNIVYWISIVFTILCLISCIINIPLGAPEGGAPEEEFTAYQFSLLLFVMSAVFTVFFGLSVVLIFLFRRYSGVSYDYVFVSGELRIAKIFHANRRRHIVCLRPENILQVGDVDCAEYKRLEGDLATRTMILTPNIQPTHDKFFMYIYADDGVGKKLYVLECKEELLINIVKFVGRSKLASDYKKRI